MKRKVIVVLISLIFLLLNILPGWGQDGFEISYSFPEMGDSTKVIVGKDSLMTTLNPYCFAPIIFLIQQYEEYEKECYADSSIWRGYKFVSTGKTTMGMSIGYDEYIIEWVHREPTFQGFMKFLKGKVKCK